MENKHKLSVIFWLEWNNKRNLFFSWQLQRLFFISNAFWCIIFVVFRWHHGREALIIINRRLRHVESSWNPAYGERRNIYWNIEEKSLSKMKIVPFLIIFNPRLKWHQFQLFQYFFWNIFYSTFISANEMHFHFFFKGYTMFLMINIY